MPTPPAAAATESPLQDVLHQRLLSVAPAGSLAPPGGVLGVSSPAGRTVVSTGHRQVFGDAGPLEHPVPMTAGTAHDLGSLTKLVATTTALLTRLDRGALSLDAPLAELLPAAHTSPLGAVTCRELLLHRAGLWEWWPLYVDARSAGEAIDLVLRLAPRYERDSGRHYSDLGFMLLGAVVADDRPLADVVHDLVLRPLGLDRTSYAAPYGDDFACGAPGDDVERGMLATGEPYPVPIATSAYDRWRVRVRAGEVDDGNAFHAFGGVAGHAGLFSTAGDLLTWGEALLVSLRGEGPWRSTTVSAFFAAGPDEGQRLGFRSWQTTSGDCTTEVLGHPGFPGVVAGVLPDHDTCVVLLTNRLHVRDPLRACETEPLWRAVLDDVHDTLHHDEPTAVA
jgi:CubicO group peptidase (beta-lactamase class C family)